MLSSAAIKKQILETTSTNIRRKPSEIPEGMTEGDILELGNSLEKMTKTSGWAVVESFMLSRMNLVGMVLSNTSGDVDKGVAQGYINLMQYVDHTIKQKNVIEERERSKHETKTVQEDKKE